MITGNALIVITMANIARTGQSKRIDTRRFSIYAPDRFELFWILLGKARGLYAETATCQRHASNYWSLFLPGQFRWNELGGNLNAERTPNTSPTPQPAPFPVFGIKAGRPRFRNRSFFKQADAQEGFKTIISSSRILALSYPLSSASRIRVRPGYSRRFAAYLLDSHVRLVVAVTRKGQRKKRTGIRCFSSIWGFFTAPLLARSGHLQDPVVHG